jgi:hypothetical protein
MSFSHVERFGLAEPAAINWNASVKKIAKLNLDAGIMFLHYDFVHACCAKNFKFIGFV